MRIVRHGHQRRACTAGIGIGCCPAAPSVRPLCCRKLLGVPLATQKSQTLRVYLSSDFLFPRFSSPRLGHQVSPFSDTRLAQLALSAFLFLFFLCVWLSSSKKNHVKMVESSSFDKFHHFSTHNVRSSSTISFSREDSDEGILTFIVT